MKIFRSVLFGSIALYFLVNAVISGNPGSIVLALILAGIALYVGFTGKVHSKFTNARKDGKDVEDAKFETVVKNLWNKLTGRQITQPLIAALPANEIVSKKETVDG